MGAILSPVDNSKSLWSSANEAKLTENVPVCRIEGGTFIQRTHAKDIYAYHDKEHAAAATEGTFQQHKPAGQPLSNKENIIVKPSAGNVEGQKYVYFVSSKSRSK